MYTTIDIGMVDAETWARRRPSGVTIDISSGDGADLHLVFGSRREIESFLETAMVAAEAMADVDQSRKFGEDGAR